MDEQKMGGTCDCSGCAGCHGGSGMHWVCCIVPILSLVFWVGGIVALVLAWAAGDQMVWGKADAFWYLNALALGVLATYGRGKKWGSCRGGACNNCKDGVCACK